MFAIIASIAKFLAGLIDFAQQVNHDRELQQARDEGRLEQQTVEQTQKASDEAIAKAVDAQPTPVDRHRILDGMRSSSSTNG